jgi:hypothetical protein
MKLLLAVYLFFVPFVWAGEDRVLFVPTDRIFLTSDATGGIVQYQWLLLTGPPGAALCSPDKANTLVTGMVQGTYTFRIRVTDSLGAQHADTLRVIVYAKNKRLRYSEIKMIE